MAYEDKKNTITREALLTALKTTGLGITSNSVTVEIKVYQNRAVATWREPVAQPEPAAPVIKTAPITPPTTETPDTGE